MNNYETLFIVRQEATTAQVETIADELVALIDEKGGKLARRESWGLRTLAYRIRKSRKGHYILLNYESDSEAVDALQYRMRYSEDIVRYMTIRTEDLPTEPSVQMRQADEDADGDDAATTDDKDKAKKDKGYRPRRKASDEADETTDEAAPGDDDEAPADEAPEEEAPEEEAKES